MSQTEFLKIFNDLEQTLQNKYDSTETIYDLLDREKNALESNPVKANWEILDIARRLRNLLAHETKTNLPVVATPSQQIIDILKKVTHDYQHPKSLADFLAEGQREKIFSFKVTDSLMDVLKVIHQKHFSQFPVFDNKGYVGIISNSGIANWLAALSQKGTFSSEDLHRIKIAEVIPFEENGDAVISLFKETTLHQTLHHFTGTKVRVAIVCHRKNLNIQSAADIAGIITKSDLGQMIKDLQ